MSKPADRFWETTALDDLDDTQWESLCDGCGRCCLQKLEDSDTGDIYFTRVACKLLDLNSCRCQAYADRMSLVPDCTMVRPLTDEKRQWLPDTCAYRRLAEGKSLLPWHPLISGNRKSVQEAGITVSSLAVSETEVPVKHYQKHIIYFADHPGKACRS